MIGCLPTPSTYTRLLLQGTPKEQWPELLQGTGLQSDSLPSFETIRADQQIQVFRNAKLIASNPDWALALGQQLNVNSHGSLGFAVLSAPTLGECLETLASFARIRAPYMLFKFEYLQDRCRFTIEPALELGDLKIEVDEIVLQVVDSMIKVVLGNTSPDVEIMLDYPVPPHATAYAHYFSARCVFEQAFSGVELPLNMGRIPCPLHDQQSYVASLARCRVALAAIIDPSDAVTRVRNLLISHFEKIATGTLSSAPPSLESIADTLSTAPRTLIRRLTAQDSGYREILEEERRKASCELLGKARYSVGEISDLLGYSDASAFGRAFRRWFGVAPGKYRRQ